jgi:hypothetical protein
MAKPLPPPDRFAPHAIGGAASKGRLMLRVNSSRAPVPYLPGAPLSDAL